MGNNRLLAFAAALALAPLPANAQSSPIKFDSTNSLNPNLVTDSAALLTVLVATNSTATPYFLKLYDTVTTPTCGSGTPVFKIAVPATGQVVVPVSNLGMRFQKGVGFCLTAGITDSDTGDAAEGVTINFAVKQ